MTPLHTLAEQEDAIKEEMLVGLISALAEQIETLPDNHQRRSLQYKLFSYRQQLNLLRASR